MKRSFVLLLGGLLLLLTGCAKASVETTPTATAAPVPAVSAAPVTAAPTAEPTAAPVQVPADRQAGPEEERILSHCLSILDQLPYSVDLDGDGQNEVVDLVTYTPADGYPCWAVTVHRGGEVIRAETEIPDDMEHDLWTGDIDEDGRYELFFHGDMASADYVIYAWRCDLSPIPFDPDDRLVRWNEENEDESNVFAGYVDGFEDGHIVIEGVVDMLGTHWGVRNFAIGEDGTIGPVSTVWSFDEEEDRALTVTRELTAYRAATRKDPGEAFTLTPGEKIVVTASDGCERMWFETDEGKSGVLLLTPDRDDMWLIDGVPEADFFESLPYSG